MKLIPILSEIESKYQKLYSSYYLAYWNASLTGKESDWNKVTKSQIELTKFFQNRDYFNQLEKLKSQLSSYDEINQRAINILYREFLPNQYDINKLEQIIFIQNKVENVFSTFRTNINGKTLTDNEVDEILKKETNSKILREVWEANKFIGELILEDLFELVKLRNEQARYFGFKNFHDMSLHLSELDKNFIDHTFNYLYQRIINSYKKIKEQIDHDLAILYNINENELMPWHYQGRFFQEAPAIYSYDFDKYYKNADLVSITKSYYKSIGLFIEDIIEKSDLYEKDGKNQHAFCINIDRNGDIRVLCNIRPNVDWMSTMLHEFGHAIYDKYIDRNLPFILKDSAHIFITEAVALLFGKLATHPVWIKETFNVNEDQFINFKNSAIKLLKINQLIFTNWVIVMYEFEKELYENPEQNLNELWWKLHNNYLQINTPFNRNKPDWASKIHIATSPCYYHNYLLGEIFASQLNQYLHSKILCNQNVLDSVIINNFLIGEFLINELFKFGSSKRWEDVINISVKENLNPEYYINHYSIL